MRKIILSLILIAFLATFVNSVSVSDMESESGFECTSYSGSVLGEGKKGYDFCEEKGQSDLCIINRHTSRKWYSGSDCSSGFRYDNSNIAVLTCHNQLEYDYSHCGNYIGVPDSPSLYKGHKDEVICCKAPKTTEMDCAIYGGSMVDEDETGFDVCEKYDYPDFCLISRQSTEALYSSTDCTGGVQSEVGATETLSCDTRVKVGRYTDCEVNGDSQGSKKELLMDGIICCKSNSADKCIDSDSGENIYEKGIVTINDKEYHDSCRRGVLTELYCSNGRYLMNEYDCPEGCEDGACLGGTEDDEDEELEDDEVVVEIQDKEHFLVVGDQSPSSDVIIISNLGASFASKYKFLSRLNREVTKDMLDYRVTTFVFMGNGIIILGDHSSAEDARLAAGISRYLQSEEGIRAKTILSSEVKHDDLRKLIYTKDAVYCEDEAAQ